MPLGGRQAPPLRYPVAPRGGSTGQLIAVTTGSVIGLVVGASVASKASTKLVWQVSVRYEAGIDRSFTVDRQPDDRPGDLQPHRLRAKQPP